jgi:hypothetical protein
LIRSTLPSLSSQEVDLQINAFSNLLNQLELIYIP